MKTKLTAVSAVLLLAVLAMPEFAEAQGGWNVRRATDVMKVAEGANNAAVNNLDFIRTGSNENDIANAGTAGDMLTIKIGYGLIITNNDSVRGDDSADFPLWCGETSTALTEPVACDQSANPIHPAATFSNKDGKGVITIKVGSRTRADGTKISFAHSFRVAGVRVDASALSVEDKLMATITSTTDASSVSFGGGSSSGDDVSGVVGEVSDALKVTASKDAALSCSSKTTMPSITVAEGYPLAWGPTNMQAHSGMEDYQTASVKIVLDNLSDDDKVEWPESVNSLIDPDEDADEANINGKLLLDESMSSSNGRTVVYTYMSAGTKMDKARSFTISPSKTTFSGDASVDVAAMLYPAAMRGTDGEKLNLDSELSFEHPMEAPEEGKGEGWLIISECVTYLLYPFVTCGATPGWSTGISVSNTSADGNVFGAFDEAKEQSGSVVLYGFPSGQAMPAEGEMVMPVVTMVSPKLMAGDTITFNCGDTMMAGMQGYAIIKADFQHARGMGFVLGDFADGAAVDVAHGYMAEVIANPADRGEAIE